MTKEYEVLAAAMLDFEKKETKPEVVYIVAHHKKRYLLFLRLQYLNRKCTTEKVWYKSKNINQDQDFIRVQTYFLYKPLYPKFDKTSFCCH